VKLEVSIPAILSFLDIGYSLRRHIFKKRVEDVKSLTIQPDIIYHRLSAYSSLCLKDRDFRKTTVDEECSHSDGSINNRKSELSGAQTGLRKRKPGHGRGDHVLDTSALYAVALLT